MCTISGDWLPRYEILINYYQINKQTEPYPSIFFNVNNFLPNTAVYGRLLYKSVRYLFVVDTRITPDIYMIFGLSVDIIF